jgi:gamma-tubulin complex component 5
VDSLSRVCAGAEFLLQLVNSVIPSGQLENAVVAAELATHILDYLYENLSEFCLVQDGEDEPYHTSLLLFIGSLRPLIESLDSWLHEGTLSDPFGELFFLGQ